MKEAVARTEGEKKQPPFGKYILPLAHFHLSTFYTDSNQYDLAKSHLNKARDGYKDYELEDRIQTQIRSLQRRIKLLHDDPKEREAAEKKDKEEKHAKETLEKNFFIKWTQVHLKYEVLFSKRIDKCYNQEKNSHFLLMSD